MPQGVKRTPKTSGRAGIFDSKRTLTISNSSVIPAQAGILQKPPLRDLRFRGNDFHRFLFLAEERSSAIILDAVIRAGHQNRYWPPHAGPKRQAPLLSRPELDHGGYGEKKPLPDEFHC